MSEQMNEPFIHAYSQTTR